MKISIMQPYFLPYIGYWQLLANADKFVLYDDVEYSKNGWINRNRFAGGSYFTVPVTKGHNSDKINMKEIAADWPLKRRKILRTVRQLYGKAPNFQFAYPLIEDIFLAPQRTLFEFIYHSILRIRSYLMITTPLLIASELFIPQELHKQERVIACCKKVGPSWVEKTYVNAIGGTALYSASIFAAEGMNLRFLRTKEPPENCLSILDLMMRFHREELMEKLNNFEELPAEGV